MPADDTLTHRKRRSEIAVHLFGAVYVQGLVTALRSAELTFWHECLCFDLFFGRCVVSREGSGVNVRCFHLTMNKTKNTSPFNVLGAFGRSGFFKKAPDGKASVQVVRRRPYEAATPAQTARLCEVLGYGMSSSQLRF